MGVLRGDRDKEFAIVGVESIEKHSIAVLFRQVASVYKRSTEAYKLPVVL